MKYIHKENSPIEFEDWKNDKKLTTNDLAKKRNIYKDREEIWKKFTKKSDIKAKVKDALLREQGNICAYCQQKIDNSSKTTIEHLIPRDKEPAKMFDYEANLLACCDGGQGENADRDKATSPQAFPEYCGKHKANKIIEIHPYQVDCESHFQYIYKSSENEVVIEGLNQDAINTIEKLNLNTPKLRNLRGAVVKGFLLDDFTVDEIDSLIFQLRRRNSQFNFEPFCVVIIHILNVVRKNI